MNVEELKPKNGHHLVTGTVTGASAPTSAKLNLGNSYKKTVESLIPFLAGGALIGVLCLSYFTPIMIQLSMERVEARIDAKFAQVKTDTGVAKQDAKLAKEDALTALERVTQLKDRVK